MLDSIIENISFYKKIHANTEFSLYFAKQLYSLDNQIYGCIYELIKNSPIYELLYKVPPTGLEPVFWP